MSELAALKAVTSVPARPIRLDHRIGLVKPGRDADLVVWSSHPLSVGATPLQVYVDGRETLDEDLSREHLSNLLSRSSTNIPRPQQQAVLSEDLRREVCDPIMQSSSVVVTGIKKSFLNSQQAQAEHTTDMTLVLKDGEISCFGSRESCAVVDDDLPHIHLQNGRVLPGLIAVTTGLGLEEIPSESSTGDGGVPSKLEVSDPSNLIDAKYGIHLEGKAFRRAQIGGVTRAVSIPHVDDGGFGGAVSVGIKTSEVNTTLDGELFQDEVGLHFVVGQDAKASTETVSAAVAKLRKLLVDNVGKENIYGAAVKGRIPLVVHTENKVNHKRCSSPSCQLTRSNSMTSFSL